MHKDQIILVLLIAFCHWMLQVSYALTSPSFVSHHLQSISIRSSRTEQAGCPSSHASDNRRPWATALQPLFARRSAGGPGGKKGGPGAGKKKKKSGGGPPTNKKGNPKKTRKTTKSEKKVEKFASIAPTGPSSDSQKKNKKKQSHQAPPWQVVSKKDMARNVKAEKKRRKLAKEEGIHNVDVLLEEEQDSLRLSQSFLSVQDKALLAWKRFKAQPRQDSVDFVGAYLNKQIPPTLGAPEVAFLGRSNVGKSSLLNRLTQSDEARVGKTPGATASVNLYGLYREGQNNKRAAKCLMGLVDLPGFGYAKLSKENKEAVQMAAERYLASRKELMLGILLVDIRRVPSEDDKAVLAALYDSGVPIIVVATKVDKITTASLSSDGPPPSELIKALEEINQGLGLPEGQPLCVSSVTGEGIKDLWRIIMEACEEGVEELRAKLLEQGGANDDQLDGSVMEEAGGVAYEDGEDVVYSQGYDWIHDSASVMYEDEYGDTGGGYVDYVSWDNEEGNGMDMDLEDGDFEEYDNPDFDIMQEGSMPRKSLKELRKQADEMQRRGQL